MTRNNELAGQISDLFNSDAMVATIADINRHLGLEGEALRIVPYLIYQLEIKGLAPQDFVKTLADYFGVDESFAKAITQRIKENALKQGAVTLLRWGIDINLIDASNAPSFEETIRSKSETFKEREAQKTISLENLGERVQITAEKIPETPKPISPPPTPTTIPAEEIKPLILHQEKPLTEEVKKTGGKVFSFPFEIFKTKEGGGAQKPVTAKIETLETETAEKEMKQPPPTLRTETPQKRLVNYTEFRTPLSPFGKEEVINLENLEKSNAAPKPEQVKPAEPTT